MVILYIWSIYVLIALDELLTAAIFLWLKISATIHGVKEITAARLSPLVWNEIRYVTFIPYQSL
jgi:hypothetical protein